MQRKLKTRNQQEEVEKGSSDENDFEAMGQKTALEEKNGKSSERRNQKTGMMRTRRKKKNVLMKSRRKTKNQRRTFCDCVLFWRMRRKKKQNVKNRERKPKERKKKGKENDEKDRPLEME